jgi:hypothetical protein
MKTVITPERKTELEKAFDEVRSHKDWKRRISKMIYASSKQQALIAEAVMFFTGSVATFTPAAHGRVRIEAAGYYASEVQR